MIRFAYASCAMVVAATLTCGCTSSRLPNDPREFPDVGQPERLVVPDGPRNGYMARLRPANGSAATGSVGVIERNGVMIVSLQINNVLPGFYAWAFHEKGSCASKNGFSAGSGWVPPGAKRTPVDLLPEFVVNTESSGTVTARVRDVRIEGERGINGRTVLVYQGGNIQPIKADVPNNVVACGVFEPAQSLLL